MVLGGGAFPYERGNPVRNAVIGLTPKSGRSSFLQRPRIRALMPTSDARARGHAGYELVSTLEKKHSRDHGRGVTTSAWKQSCSGMKTG